MSRMLRLIVVAAGMAAAVEIASGELVAHWKLNDGTGGLARDSAGTNDGIVRGGAVWVDGVKGGALMFDGTDDCVEIGTKPEFNPEGSFSVAIWANIQDWSSEWVHTLIGNRSDGVGWCLRRFGSWWASQYPNTYTQPVNALSFTTRGVGHTGDSVEDTPSSTVPPLNEWVHIACVYDNENNLKYIYFNGVENAKWQTNPGKVTAATQRLYIGARSNAANTGPEGLFTGILDDVRFYNHALSPEEIKQIIAYQELPVAAKPYPGLNATDVRRDVVLSWLAGPYAKTHDVYLGTDFDDVNSASRDDPKGVLLSRDQQQSTFEPPGLLAYGQTYYWRVDEVNGPPDYTIFPGVVWSFTVEPYAYPLTPVAVTASSTFNQAMTPPERTIDGSGMKGDGHSIALTDMWLSNPKGPTPPWIQYEFDKPYKLYQLWVWNSNQLTEAISGFGAKTVSITLSTDGVNWVELPDVQEFAQAPGEEGYKTDIIVDMKGKVAKFVRLTINETWSGGNRASLSEVRFYQIPTQAFLPEPPDGATDVPLDTVLRWRPGREAGSHTLYIGTDQAAISAGTVSPVVLSEARYGLSALNPGYGQTYYWRVDEVNQAAEPPVWQGDIWGFKTIGYAVVDDFESYNDDCNRIFFAWLDGLGHSGATQCNVGPAGGNGTGSTVGNLSAPYAERSVVYAGGQSMPFAYDNTKPPYYSEAKRTFLPAQSWKKVGLEYLTLFVWGEAVGFAEVSPGLILMNGQGADIWDTTDQFRFVYKRLSGNGSLTARVMSVTDSHEWAKAGVMIREGLDSSSRHAMVVVTPRQGVSFQRRLESGGTSYNTDLKGVNAPYWVRITRTGNTFIGECSADGLTWTPVGADATQSQATIEMPSDVYIGLAVCSHVANVPTAAMFSDVASSGLVSGNWVSAEIGATQPLGNVPDKIYVEVEDTAGTKKLVVNPDPYQIAKGLWVQWDIPLSTFTSAGVNIEAIKALTVGIGDRSSPKATGTGKVYIDEIRLTVAGQ
ncbi:MAG: discoidin domain-containing protein [Sedimentisphaerales bacterium]|nr:discoidin domain-containing protein [Sedimentisphaerales bacterium]